ncbi:hypothetical protein AB0D82_14730, partial [Streptomyces sp. NPDC048272]
MAGASHAVVREARDAAVWVFGGGPERRRASVVAEHPEVEGAQQLQHAAADEGRPDDADGAAV